MVTVTPVPRVTPVGTLPKPSRIDSPSSSTVSLTAVIVKVCDSSPPSLNVTLGGTPE